MKKHELSADEQETLRQITRMNLDEWSKWFVLKSQTRGIAALRWRWLRNHSGPDRARRVFLALRSARRKLLKVNVENIAPYWRTFRTKTGTRIG